MRIVHTILTGEFAGSEQYVARLAIAQLKQGHDVRVVVKPTAHRGHLKMMDQIGKENVIKLSRATPRTLRPHLFNFLIEKFSPQILQNHDLAACEITKRAALKRGIPSIGTLHSAYDANAHHGCDAIVAVADYQLDTIEKFSGKKTLIRNWVDEKPGASASARANFRKEIGVSENTFVFLLLGRLAKVKCIDIAIKAFQAAFKDSDMDVALIVAGSGKEQTYLQKLAGTDNRIRFIGWQENANLVLSSSDSYISAARWEGLSLALLEAAHAQLPIIISNCDGNASFHSRQSNREFPRLFEVDDMDALSAHMLDVSGTRKHDIRYDLSAFSLSAAMRSYDDLYQDLINVKSQNQNARMAQFRTSIVLPQAMQPTRLDLWEAERDENVKKVKPLPAA